MKANESIWNQLLQAENETLKTHLNYLGCTEKQSIIVEHINYVMMGEKLKSSKDTYFDQIFRNILKNPSNVDIAIDSFINNYDEIIKQ